MRTVTKILLALVVVLPMTAYVAGSLAGASSDTPRPRDTIMIDRVSDDSRGSNPTSPTDDPTARTEDDRGDDTGNESDDDGDDGIHTLTPSPDDLDDDTDGGSNSGPGGGDDDDLNGDDSGSGGDDDRYDD